MAHLTADELLDYTNGERKKWHQWFLVHPQAMGPPAQRQGRFPNVGSLIDHIFLVVRRHVQRLNGQSAIAAQTGTPGSNLRGIMTCSIATHWNSPAAIMSSLNLTLEASHA